MKVWPGQEVTLSCKATGVPLPALSWHFRRHGDSREALLTPGSGVKLKGVHSAKNMSIQSTLQVVAGDSGTYRCRSSNRFNSSSVYVQVIVQGKHAYHSFAKCLAYLALLTAHYYTTVNRTNNDTPPPPFSHKKSAVTCELLLFTRLCECGRMISWSEVSVGIRELLLYLRLVFTRLNVCSSAVGFLSFPYTVLKMVHGKMMYCFPMSFPKLSSSSRVHVCMCDMSMCAVVVNSHVVSLLVRLFEGTVMLFTVRVLQPLPLSQ